MRKRLQNIMFEIGYILELIIAFVVGVSVLILSVRLLGQALNSSLFQEDDILVSILDKAMTLAIGVEFIKMLVKHTPCLLYTSAPASPSFVIGISYRRLNSAALYKNPFIT